MVLGDFNVDYGRYTANSAVKMLADTISSLGCEQLISCPTRISPSKQSILDHVYVNNSMINSVFLRTQEITCYLCVYRNECLYVCFCVSYSFFFPLFFFFINFFF